MNRKIEKPEPAWWSVDNVRHIVFGDQISRSSIYNFCRSGEIPSKKFGNKYFIPNSWVRYQLQQGNKISFSDINFNVEESGGFNA